MVLIMWIGEAPGPPREGDFLLLDSDRVALEPFHDLKMARRRANRTLRKMRAEGYVDETGPWWQWTVNR
jgi:hypothetical protein